MKNKTLKVNEIFYSLQGEGKRSGEATIFIRLSGCNLNCWFCDTNYTEGKNMSLNHIKTTISQYKAKWIVWTGGEPTLQLTTIIMEYFVNLGYRNAIESNGLKELPGFISHRVISPKNNYDKIKQFNPIVEEIRIPFGINMKIPSIELLPIALNYYLSPIFLGDQKKRFKLDKKTLDACINYIKLNPEWKLSIQNHKLWKIQ